MRYCQSCDAELPDHTERCPTCQGALSESPPEIEESFVVAGSADFPLLAENLAQAVDAAGIPAMIRPMRRGVVDPITSPVLHEWWQILVPASRRERAMALIEQEQERIDANAEEAARAAEEEEAEGERQMQQQASETPARSAAAPGAGEGPRRG